MTKKGNIPDLLIISGPTASGKSAIAESLALQYGLPVISADSRQVYRNMNIGTAKATPEILEKIEYHLIDFLDPDQMYSAGKFSRDVLRLLRGKLSQQKVVIVAGGTGFYIKALTEGLADIPDIRDEIRYKWSTLLDTKGLDHLKEILIAKDPGYSKSVDLHNPHRVLRALQVLDQTGRSITQFRQGEKLTGTYNYTEYAMDLERSELYDRINKRVDRMIENGLVAEVKSLAPYFDFPSLNTVGYKEIIQYIRGQITLDEAVDKIKQHTRNFAKRQFTWFRKHGNWNRIRPGEKEVLQRWIEARL